MSTVHYLTKQKAKELEEELHDLKHVVRAEVARALDEARSLGDLSENAEYHEARERQAIVEHRIAELEEILKNVTIVSPRKKSDTVAVGSTVIVRKGSSKEEKTFHIVGIEEADIAEGRISNTSPLAKAMMKKKKGDQFEYTAPNGKTMKYTIVNVT